MSNTTGLLYQLVQSSLNKRSYLSSELSSRIIISSKRAGELGATPGPVEMEDPWLNDEPSLRGESHVT